MIEKSIFLSFVWLQWRVSFGVRPTGPSAKARHLRVNVPFSQPPSQHAAGRRIGGWSPALFQPAENGVLLGSSRPFMISRRLRTGKDVAVGRRASHTNEMRVRREEGPARHYFYGGKLRQRQKPFLTWAKSLHQTKQTLPSFEGRASEQGACQAYLRAKDGRLRSLFASETPWLVGFRLKVSKCVGLMKNFEYTR